VVVKLGLPDLLADGPKSADALAAQIGANADALFRLMRVLAVHNIFVEQNEKRFGLTDWSNMLRSDKPGSMRDYMLLAGEPAAWRACENLEYSIITGKAAFDHTLGQSWFAYLDANPPVGRIFDNAMRSRGAADDAAILNVFDFSKFRRIADLGAGEGALLSAALQTSTQASGILLPIKTKNLRLSSRSTADGCPNVFSLAPKPQRPPASSVTPTRRPDRRRDCRLRLR
jgi:hypothetical protein